MNISAELFTQILSQLTSDNIKPDPHERRTSPRVGVRAKIRFERPVLGDAGIEKNMVTVREISRGGIGFLYTKRITRGEVVRAFFDKGEGGHLVAEYTVCHCVTLSGGQFLVGARLEQVTEVAPQKAAPRLRNNITKAA
jgi:hypothetical protein